MGDAHENTIFLEDSFLVNKNLEISNFHYLIICVIVALVFEVNLAILTWMKVKKIGLLLLAFAIRVWNNRFVCGISTCFTVYTITLDR